MARMICPLMSGPVGWDAGGHPHTDIVEKPCIGSRCAFWRWSRNTHGEIRKPRGRCGYATSQGGEFFVDPQMDGKVPPPPRTDGGSP